MKKILVIFLIFLIVFQSTFATAIAVDEKDVELNITQLSDPALLGYIEDTVYLELLDELEGRDFFVENVQAIYISKEYLDEVAYNSKANIYFGYTLEALQKQFGSEKYIFTTDANGQTTVECFEKYDDSYDKALRNVVIGSGVILLCVTVSVATAGAAPAVSMILAASAKTATKMAVSSGLISGIVAGAITGFETKDFDKALKAATLSGSEGFKWGAITGALIGGGSEAKILKGATTNGLSMNQVASIQRESKYPIDVIKQFSSYEQYDICKNAGLSSGMIDGRIALVRNNINPSYVDEFGRTNIQRMSQGLAPLDDATGYAFQLHHIGQKPDSTLAVLTSAEHMQGGNNTIWHDVTKASEIDRVEFRGQRESFWKAYAERIVAASGE